MASLPDNAKCFQTTFQWLLLVVHVTQDHAGIAWIGASPRCPRFSWAVAAMLVEVGSETRGSTCGKEPLW
ncbi:MAG: hypothetical protein RMJ98_13855 [Myxococcales bacterium]|nr:hypothetical protein [Myxococcales bacterium]